jgi:hypothetical protein
MTANERILYNEVLSLIYNYQEDGNGDVDGYFIDDLKEHYIPVLKDVVSNIKKDRSE